MNNKYFKGLDTLRAISAFVVVFAHIELIKTENNLDGYGGIDASRFPDAHLAVVLFFVLSGFLITNLLVKEKELTGQVSLKKFYIRRIGRIWPLYYFVLLLSYILFRPTLQAKTIAMCLAIFPNVAHALNIGWEVSPQVWSIGVEEQFYLFWPLLIYFLQTKYLIRTLILFTIAYTFLPHLIHWWNNIFLQSQEANEFTDRFFYLSKFNCMSIGGIFGSMYSLKRKELKFFYQSWISYPAIILSLFLWFIGFSASIFNDVLYSILFGIMILNLATNSNLKFSIDSKASTFLGKISYGIYMYHWIVILLLVRYLPVKQISSSVLYNLILYSASLSGTILISFLSFYYFENKVRRQKG